MYNSLASSQEQGSKGSTRLHMDMADAFNVMVYTTDCEDGTPGYAVWDLFRAEDSDKIRAFLRKRFTPGSVAMSATVNGQTQSPAEKAAALQLQAIALHDPIHSQHFYLDVELRKELWEQYSVKSFRIYQRPGEDVFIPAGCAHQVCFLVKLLFIY
jgi:lysine-specific demethylase 3